MLYVYVKNTYTLPETNVMRNNIVR